MRKTLLAALLLIVCLDVPCLFAQDAAPSDQVQTTFRIHSRAVLEDVVVTDRKGNPVSGLTQNDFTIMEGGKPQTIEFFEAHNGVRAPSEKIELPKLPENVFTNYSPFPQPPAVTILLLDSLNTPMEHQSFVHKQALKFLQSAKPGERMAIFAMGLGLHFIQGFNDDPTVLLAALNNKKNNEVENAVMLKAQAETNAQANLVGMMSTDMGHGATAGSAGSISALQNFFAESDFTQSLDRYHLTLDNLRRLARFLDGVPGRKNLIWFSGSVPSIFIQGSAGVSSAAPAIEKDLRDTLAMLASARVAIYPVDPSGAAPYVLFSAENNMPHFDNPAQLSGANGEIPKALTGESMARNLKQAAAELFAEQTGGKAFFNMNDLSRIMSDIALGAGNFYSLSYKPTNAKMDGTFRKIEIKVNGDYKLFYRRGYFAVENGLPGESLSARDRELQRVAARNPGHTDPLLPFMDLGMPQIQQIVYQEKVQVQSGDDQAAEKDKQQYKVNFVIDTKQLDLPLDADGFHDGLVTISMIAYDRYGNIISRKDQLAALNIKPDVWDRFQKEGVHLHGEISVPKGNYWLRTGIYDHYTNKAGTTEIPLDAVKLTKAEDN